MTWKRGRNAIPVHLHSLSKLRILSNSDWINNKAMGDSINVYYEVGNSNFCLIAINHKVQSNGRYMSFLIDSPFNVVKSGNGYS